MTEENPTGGDAGASITDRLERYLAAEDSPAPEPKAEAKAPEQAPETQAAPKTEKPEEDAPETAQQPQLTTTDLAKVLGIDESALDVDADGNVSIKTKIDGKEGAAKFADLLKTHQIQGHAENRAREVAQREAALQTRAQEVEQQFKQRLDHADQLTTLAAQELMAEFQSINWKELDQHPDQGAVAALKLKFQERNAKIQQAQQGINAHRWQLNQQSEAQQEQRVRAETEKLPTLITEWRDAAVAAKEVKELVEWARGVGYTDNEIAALNKSSALHVANTRKAMLFDKLQQSKAVVENKVRLAPKIVKPGQAQTDGPGDKLRSLKQNVMKSGGKNGALEAYLIATGKA